MRKKLFFRNLLILMLLISLPTLTAAQLGLRYTENVIRDKETRTARAELDFLNQYMDSSLQLCSAVVTQVENDTALLDWLRGMSAVRQTASAVRPMFQRWSQMADLLITAGASSVYLYLDGADMVLSTDGLRQLKTMQDDSWLGIYRAHQDWFGLSSFLTYARKDAYGNQVVSCLLPLLNAQGTCSGVFVVNLGARFMRALAQQSAYESAALYLFNEQGEQFYPAESDIHTLFPQEKLDALFHGGTENVTDADGAAYIAISRESPQYDWHFLLLVQENELFADLQALKNVYPLLLVMALVLAALFALFYTIQSTRPIVNLIGIIEKYQRSGVVEKPPTFRSDAYQYVGYNLINALAEKNAMQLQVAQLELNEKEAQMRAIQSRINPHFLYNNALETANWAAVRSLGPKNEVSHILKAMADNFRSILSDQRLMVTLQEELHQLQNYVIFLQCVDYRDLRVQVDAPENTLPFEVPRMLFQPLVENAYVHGLNKTPHPVIRVKTRLRTDCLEFFVTDNGCGLDPERLQEWNATLQTRTPIGLKGASGLCNVNNRLLLCYGPACHLTLYSRSGHGTAVRFLIPLHAREVDVR